MTSSYVDAPQLTRCDAITTRTWTFSDNCGKSTVFQQTIKVLPLQDPSYPKNGELNVHLHQTLKWPLYPNSNRYRIFIWKFGTSRTKGIELFQNYYNPSKDASYPPNSRMLWQIEYILDRGHVVNNISTVPSPVWGFVTQQIPDFKIISVKVPNEVFTGRVLQVSWTVKNIGTRGNAKYYWYDRVLLSKDINAFQGLVTKTVRRQGFLFPNDGYTGTSTLSIPNDITGAYYVRVFVDINGYVDDINRSNNYVSSLEPITIKLTPPPDLQVTRVVIPTKSFSGILYILTTVLFN